MPQLARSAKDLPEGDEWRYEPKWDGFRTIVFRDGADVRLQSRNGRPMNRYFPEVVEQVLALPAQRVVLDAELIVVVDGVQEFDLLSQRIHPAASRVERLARETPAGLAAFDLLAEDDEALLELPYEERRARLPAVVEAPVQLTPTTAELAAAREWLGGSSEGVVAKQATAPYQPGERTGMVKIKRVRTADAVVAAFRFGKEPGTVGSLILGMYTDDGELRVVGHTSSFQPSRSASCSSCSSLTGPTSAVPEPSRWKSDEELVWEGSGPSSSARSTSTTSPATASATAPSSCAGAPTGKRGTA